MSFLKIAITRNGFIEGEARMIVRLLESGFDAVHIRKPGWNAQELSTLIEDIPATYHPRLRIHDCFELVNRYNLGGIHLNGRNPYPCPGAKSVSRSCHSLEEILAPTPAGYDFAYQTLSPIFDSFSKPGYKSRFDLISVIPYIKGRRVIAMGGVDSSRLQMLEEAGFYGAAMLDAAWR